jgi:hypothetical protein
LCEELIFLVALDDGFEEVARVGVVWSVFCGGGEEEGFRREAT